MARFAFQAIIVGCAALLFGCTTVATRTQERQGAFNALSPDDQKLVSSGTIRPGLGADAVYIAWGKPSRIEPAGPNTETWIYIHDQAQTVYYYDTVPAAGPRGLTPQVVDKPMTVLHPYVWRTVTLKDGKVVAWTGPKS